MHFLVGLLFQNFRDTPLALSKIFRTKHFENFVRTSIYPLIFAFLISTIFVSLPCMLFGYPPFFPENEKKLRDASHLSLGYPSIFIPRLSTTVQSVFLSTPIGNRVEVFLSVYPFSIEKNSRNVKSSSPYKYIEPYGQRRLYSFLACYL